MDSIIPGAIYLGDAESIKGIWGTGTKSRMPQYDSIVTVEVNAKPNEIKEFNTEMEYRNFVKQYEANGSNPEGGYLPSQAQEAIIKSGIKVLKMNTDINGGRETIVLDPSVLKIKGYGKYGNKVKPAPVAPVTPTEETIGGLPGAKYVVEGSIHQDDAPLFDKVNQVFDSVKSLFEWPEPILSLQARPQTGTGVYNKGVIGISIRNSLPRIP